jgi:hypothetical protein
MSRATIKIKELHRKLSDEEFEQAFANKSLRPGWFTHEAHLRLAFIHINKYGLEGAINHMRRQIKAFAENLGIYDKYHETVTIAAVYLVNELMQGANKADFDQFMRSAGEPLKDFKKLLAQHYSYDVFKDTQARKSFATPDLMPFI